MGQVVYVVTDESKSCYDSGGVFCGVFSCYETAAAYVDRFGGVIGQNFDIEEVIVDSP